MEIWDDGSGGAMKKTRLSEEHFTNGEDPAVGGRLSDSRGGQEAQDLRPDDLPVAQALWPARGARSEVSQTARGRKNAKLKKLVAERDFEIEVTNSWRVEVT
jgi:hypothetical protein